jgi:hypothetical protein
MKRPLLLLPFLALAAAPARAADPVTNAAGQIEDPISDLPPRPNVTQQAEAVRDLHPRGSRARPPAERERALARWGAFASARAVPRALRWLKTQQLDDGSWPGNPVASTALALWTYLDHGDLPGGNAEFGPTIERAVRFLAEDVDPDTGLFRSARGEPLAQPLGFFALALYVKETSNPVAREAAAAASRPLFAGQRPDGAWNADPFDASPEGRGDVRTTAWCFHALLENRNCKVAPSDVQEPILRANAALESFFDSATGAALRPDGTPDPATAAALFVLQPVRLHDDPVVQKAVGFLEPCVFSWPDWDGPQPWGASGTPVRDLFFVTKAKRGNGGKTFYDWNKRFLPETLARQIVVPAEESGYADLFGKPREIGWWDSPSETERESCSGGTVLPCKRWRGGECFDGETTLGDRVRDTCFSALSLMIYYAFLPDHVSADESGALSVAVETPRPKTNDSVRIQIRRKAPFLPAATNAPPARPATNAPTNSLDNGAACIDNPPHPEKQTETTNEIRQNPTNCLRP